MAFDKNCIISDKRLQQYDPSFDVQAFLDQKGSALASMGAATTISRAAEAASIDARVLVTKLQCEQGLISAKAPTDYQLDWAMGYGCPDDGAHIEKYKGFAKQVQYAAQAFHDYLQPSHNLYVGNKVGQPWAVADGTVTCKNIATATLYRYTPWIKSNLLFYNVWTGSFGEETEGTKVATLKRGDQGEAVSTLQRRLVELKIPDYSGQLLVADGDFGSRTYSAVKYFQQLHIDPVGEVGWATQILLDAASPTTDEDNDVVVPSGSLGAKIVAVAQDYHKRNIVESPYGSNKGGPAAGQADKYSVNAIQRRWFPNAGQPWCAMFVAVVVEEAGYNLPSGYGWPAVASWYKFGGDIGRRYSPSGFTPQPGDLFTIGTSSHIGIVEAVNGNTVTTIEGNSGPHKVASHYMDKNKPACYIRLG